MSVPAPPRSSEGLPARGSRGAVHKCLAAPRPLIRPRGPGLDTNSGSSAEEPAVWKHKHLQARRLGPQPSHSQSSGEGCSGNVTVSVTDHLKSMDRHREREMRTEATLSGKKLSKWSSHKPQFRGARMEAPRCSDHRSLSVQLVPGATRAQHRNFSSSTE